MADKVTIPQEKFEPRDRPQFGVLVTKDHKTWDKLFQILCYIEGIPESKKIRRLIREYVQANKDIFKNIDPHKIVVNNLYDTLHNPT